MFYKKMDLQLFEDGAGAAPGNQGGNAGGNNNGAQGSTGAAYSFEQAVTWYGGIFRITIKQMSAGGCL